MKKKLYLLLIIVSSLMFLQCTSTHMSSMKSTPVKIKDTLPSQQLIVVIAGGWDKVEGILYAFNKSGNQWTLQFSNPIVIGEKGLGAGKGIVPFEFTSVPVKHEGDGKSPAGVFKIGTAFGYANNNDASWLRNDYVKCTDTLICVDDLNSVNYNKLVQRDTAIKDYNSHEEMLLSKIYYKWGLVVKYNDDPAVAGKGSCIFLHIWGDAHSGTAGCTAMQEDNMVRLLHFIDKSQSPLLVQFTREDYDRLSTQYALPVIN